MKHFIDMEFDGIELDYGYNIQMHVDEEKATCYASTVYSDRKFVAMAERDMPSIPFEVNNEEMIFRCLYSAMREVQRQCERLHEGC